MCCRGPGRCGAVGSGPCPEPRTPARSCGTAEPGRPPPTVVRAGRSGATARRCGARWLPSGPWSAPRGPAPALGDCVRPNSTTTWQLPLCPTRTTPPCGGRAARSRRACAFTVRSAMPCAEPPHGGQGHDGAAHREVGPHAAPVPCVQPQPGHHHHSQGPGREVGVGYRGRSQRRTACFQPADEEPHGLVGRRLDDLPRVSRERGAFRSAPHPAPPRRTTRRPVPHRPAAPLPRIPTQPCLRCRFLAAARPSRRSASARFLVAARWSCGRRRARSSLPVVPSAYWRARRSRRVPWPPRRRRSGRLPACRPRPSSPRPSCGLGPGLRLAARLGGVRLPQARGGSLLRGVALLEWPVGFRRPPSREPARGGRGWPAARARVASWSLWERSMRAGSAPGNLVVAQQASLRACPTCRWPSPGSRARRRSPARRTGRCRAPPGEGG